MGNVATSEVQAVGDQVLVVTKIIQSWKNNASVTVPTEVDACLRICGNVEKIISASSRQRHAGNPGKLLKSFARKLTSLIKRLENLNKKKGKALTKALKNKATKKCFVSFVSDTDSYITQYRSELDVASESASTSGEDQEDTLASRFWDSKFPGLKMVEWGSFVSAYNSKYPDGKVETLADAYGMHKQTSIFSRSLFDDAVSDHGFPFHITDESLARAKPTNRRTGGVKSVFEKQVSSILQVDIYKIIASGDEAKAREYLQQHPDAVHDINGPRNGTPLHIAAFYGLDTMVSLLLEHGADVNRKDVDGATPFDIAARQNQLSTVKLLYAKTKNPGLHFASVGGSTEVIDWVASQLEGEQLHEVVNRQRRDGTAPLHAAAEHGHINCAVALVNAGADVDLEDEYGRTAVRVATDNDQALMIAKLRDLGADLDVADQNGHTALMAAVVDGNLDTFVALLRHGADPHAEGFDSETVAHYLARREDDLPEFVAALREYEADLDAQDKYLRTPLIHAAMTKNSDAARALLDGGADPSRADETGNTPLTVAATQRDVGMVKVLIEGGAPVNQTTTEDDPDAVLSPPLCYANDAETVTVLLEAGANPNLTDQHGRIAAVYHVHDPEIVKKLLSDEIPQRLRVGKTCKDGRTVLHFAAPFEDSLKELLDGARNTDFSVERGNFSSYAEFVNARDDTGRTALHEAAAKGTEDGVAVLAATGVVDPTIRDVAGNTALHAAAASGNVRTIPAVADLAPGLVNEQNARGETALHVAARDPTGVATSILLEQPSVDHQVRDVDGNTAHHAAFNAGNEHAMAHLGDRAMKDAGAQVGEVEVGLVWWNFNDLDLTVICPHGFRIFFRERTSPCCCGTLDVDENVDPKSDTPSEHVRFDANPAAAANRDGVYAVYVIHFANHSERRSAIENLPAKCRDPTQFLVSVKMNGVDVIRANGALSFAPVVLPPADYVVAGARNKTHMLACTFRWTKGQPLSDVWVNPALTVQAAPPPRSAAYRTPVRARPVEALAAVQASLPVHPDINFLDE